jgi:type I restriction enzyme R subunit
MSNFAFLPEPLDTVREAAINAESHIVGDPRSSCFQARFALEHVVHFLYRHERSLRQPYDTNLAALLHAPDFQKVMHPNVFQKAKLIQKMGNQAAHSERPIGRADASRIARELHHLCRWVVRNYAQDSLKHFTEWDDAKVPQPADGNKLVSRAKLEKLQEQLERKNSEALLVQLEKDAVDQELMQVKERMAEYQITLAALEDTYDYREADTRAYIIDVDLRSAGWALTEKRDREYELTGMPSNKGTGFADYVLWGDDGKPLAVVEAKRSTSDPQEGQQQAKLYADCLEQMHGQRPLIFYTNGYDIYFWDDTQYPPRRVSGYYKKKELESLIVRRGSRDGLTNVKLNEDIAGRYYQKRAIRSIFEHFNEAQRRALLVMATGTGKTRTSISMVDALQRAGRVKRALFLADRISLVNQAASAFKLHLPESSPVNLVTEKNTEGRVYVCTYPTMMGLIRERDGEEARFGVGHFDLIIIDEAHRSVYQRYGEIFEYFDSLLVGLTATPRDEVDKNTYDLFRLEQGVPTDAYELDTAVKDEFLVPPSVTQVDMRFPREGIDYNALSNEEKAHWESLDWGDDADPDAMPTEVSASAVNNWLFNTDTADKVLRYLMENGHYVNGGDQLAKTIIFARNHKHAKFIQERFDHHYPKMAGHFARVIDNKAKYPQSLIDDFSLPDKMPHIAISVDMLDTGIDVPSVANLVFFKPVYSKIKFWQMIGRGTRLCPHLFGPEMHKTDFRIFDFCGNFAWFNEQTGSMESSSPMPIGQRLFNTRVALLSGLQTSSDNENHVGLAKSVTRELHTEVAAMNTENFIVRRHLQAVEQFKTIDAWQQLDDDKRHSLINEVSGLPSELDTDNIEARLFDLTALYMQLNTFEPDIGHYERCRQRVLTSASKLEAKTSIPVVKAQLEYLSRVQEDDFWTDITLAELEDMRLRLRGLMQFIDKKEQAEVHTALTDTITGETKYEVIGVPTMTGPQYQKKVRDYLQKHLDNIVIHKLRANQPLTPTDLQALEDMLTKIGDDEGEALLSDLLERTETETIPKLVRSMVGMDRNAAVAAFSTFLDDRSLNTKQIRFIELIIDQLTARGVIEAGTLYEAPFTNVHAGGPDELFAGKDKVVESLFTALEKTAPRIAVG